MIKIENLSHQYRGRDSEAVKNINLEIGRGEIVVLLGPSGSGKSTLLRCINKIVSPSFGKVYIEGEDIISANSKRTKKIRQTIGMVFQNFNLIDRYTVLENALTGRLSYMTSFNTMINRYSEKDIERCMEVIGRIGLEELAYEKVKNLSGGEKQRVGIARALSQEPKIILADEPVSNLDPKLMRDIMDLLQKICKDDGITLVFSLHFLELARKYATRIVGLRAGKIVFDNTPEELTEESIVNIYGKTDSWFLYGRVEY